ncbi:MAG: hypothetical protein DRJ05_11490, partial [Bacteroidetes bacterium]
MIYVDKTIIIPAYAGRRVRYKKKLPIFANMNRLINFFINPFFLSVIFSLVIIFLLPPIFDKYKLELINSSITEGDREVFFADLDGDGQNEQVHIGNNHLGNAMVYIRNHTGQTINQWNFDYKLASRYRRYVCDYDSTGYKKIFVFTISNDSLYLCAVDPLRLKKHIIINRFVAKVKKHKDKYDFGISQGVFADMNGDNVKEFIFAINAGFSKFPRRVYIYDIKN